MMRECLQTGQQAGELGPIDSTSGNVFDAECAGAECRVPIDGGELTVGY